MIDNLDSNLKRTRSHLEAAADFAHRAKSYANSNDNDSASSNIRKAADEIENAVTIVNRIIRELK